MKNKAKGKVQKAKGKSVSGREFRARIIFAFCPLPFAFCLAF